MKKNQSLILVVFLLAAVLILLLMFAGSLPGSEPQDTTPSTENSTVTPLPSDSTESTPAQTSEPTQMTNPTETTEDTEPLETSEPTTPTETAAPTEDIGEMIGSLYTRAELEAMDTEVRGYGPGTTSGGKRPPYAQYDQQSFGKYGGNFIAPDNGNIYLTFDCGYEYIATDENGNKYRVTEKILDTLKEKNVKAVFFVTMPYVKEQADLVWRMINEGHAVGNHSNHHPVMPEQTIDTMVNEVMSLHNYVKEQFGYEMTLFRPPTGAFSVQSLAVVQSLGYKNVHWSFAYADYTPENQPSISSAMQTVTGRHHSGAIYLLHAVSVTNATILPDVIDFFRAEGYKLELFQ